MRCREKNLSQTLQDWQLNSLLFFKHNAEGITDVQYYREKLCGSFSEKTMFTRDLLRTLNSCNQRISMQTKMNENLL